MKKLLLIVIFFPLFTIAYGQEDCNSAIPAVSGDNVIPGTSSDYYWYTYTMLNEDHKLVMTPTAGPGPWIFTNGCEYLQNATIFELAKGEVVYIKWLANRSGDFTWNLSEQLIEPGDDCKFAVPAVSGDNTVPATSSSEYWYTYTMVNDNNKLSLTSTSGGMIKVYTNTCENLIRREGSWDNATVIGFVAGEVVYIEWSGKEFTWNLSEQPLDPGDICEFAVPAFLGDNMLPATSSEYYWYTYTMVNDGYKLALTSTSSAHVNVYTNTCENLDYRYRGEHIIEGEVVYIRWDTNEEGDFTWNLSEQPIDPPDPGDICELAVTAVSGNNTAANNVYWYTYTMVNDGNKLVLTSTSWEVGLTVYTNTCENLEVLGDAVNSGTFLGLEAGEVVYFIWGELFYAAEGDFTWDLSEQPIVPGEYCESADSAILGDNILATTSYEYWYTYTMVNEGYKLSLSSSSSEYVTVYPNACESLDWLSAGSGYQNATIAGLAVGEVVHIKWGGGGFTWNLSEQPLDSGDICELAVPGVSGVNVRPATNNDYWYSYTMVNDDHKLMLTSTSSSVVMVYPNTCENHDELGRGYQNETIIGLTAGDEVYIKWWHGGDFTWNLNEQPLDPGDNCEFATPAISGVNMLPDTIYDYWYTYTMVNDDHKLMLKATSREKMVNVYTNTCEDLDYRDGGHENTTIMGLAAGEVVYIRWSTAQGGVTWDLSEQPLTLGDNCELVEQAILGSNVLPATSSSEYWYTYTMVNDGYKLALTSSSNAGVSVYSNTCKNLDYRGDGTGNVTISGLPAGEDVYIQWSPYNDKNFAWVLRELGSPPTISSINDQNINENNNYEVYPNPTSQYLNINLKELDGTFNLALYNCLGVRVFEQLISHDFPKFDVSNLTSGTYFLKLESKKNKEISFKRVIKK